MPIVPLDRKFYADAKIGVVFVFQGSIIHDIKNDVKFVGPIRLDNTLIQPGQSKEFNRKL